MILTASGLMTSAPVLANESYLELLSSGPHWLFELTLEVLSAPAVFLVGRAWRKGVLQHLHSDLDSLRDDHQLPVASPCRQDRLRVGSPAPPARSAAEVATGKPTTTLKPAPSHQVAMSWFSLPFGLAGLAGAWSYAAHLHLAPEVLGNALGVLSTFLWLAMLGARLRHPRGPMGFAHDLRDATAGPFTALLLLTPILLVIQGRALAPDVARLTFDTLTVMMLGLAAWLTGLWISGPLDLDKLHPGYFLPSVAGGYPASVGASVFGQPHLARMLFGLGSISWLVLGTIILARLMFRPPLPDALLPTIAIQIAPSALATIAWLSLNGGRPDAVASGLTGYGILMLLAQGPMMATYRRLPFSMGFWAFTFPVTAVATATLHWLAIIQPTAVEPWGLVILGVATLLVGLIAVRTSLAFASGELKTTTTTQNPQNAGMTVAKEQPNNSDAARAA